MSFTEAKWWKKLFAKEREPKVEVLKDIQAIQESLREVPNVAKPLLQALHQLEELEKEFSVARENVLPLNLEAQAKVLDTILERYEFYQNDVDINGLRVKQLAREWRKRARHAGLKELVERKKKEMKWQFDW